LSDLPPAVQKLPIAAQRIFMGAFDGAHKTYKGDESKAFATAWAAVEKAGYTRNEQTGKWVKR
jgi:cation transport regulator ChaB